MAVSLKKVSPDIPIHLVWHGDSLNHLNEDRQKWFDTKTMCPQEYIWKKDNLSYFKAKTFLYELSPFDDTLYLDVDMVWLRKPVEEIIEQLKDIEFTIANRGEETITEKTKWLWGNPQDFKQFSDILPNYHSEFVWFKKTERVRQFFNRVQEVFENPPINPKPFAGDVADELAYTIASVQTGMKPHKVPFIPTYWMFVDKHMGLNYDFIMNNFYAFSVGGSAFSHNMRDIYDRIVTGNAAIMKAGNPWKLKTKRSYLQNRAVL